MLLRHGIQGLLVGLVLAGLGCGSQADQGVVRGQVTLSGAPLAAGTVIFRSADGSLSMFADLAEDGSFRMLTHGSAGLPPGSYQVAVKPRPAGLPEKPLVGEIHQAPPPRQSIPSRYWDAQTSGLTAEVKAGSNSPFVFDLQP